MWTSFNHLNEKINSPRFVARNFSFKKLGLHDMVNNRVDLTANRSINKYSSSGLGSLSHMAAPKWDGRKSVWQEGVFPTWEFSSTKSCEYISHQRSLDNSLAHKLLSCPSFSELEELLPSLLYLPSPPFPSPPLPLSSSLLSSPPPLPSLQSLYRFWKRQILCTVYLFHYFVSQ